MSLNFFRVSKGLTLIGQASAPGTPENGDAYYNSTTGLFQFRQAGAWIGFGTTKTFHAVSSADYIVLDNDGFDFFTFTTGSSNRTLTLPTAADNTDRTIFVKKVDSGSGTVIVDGEGAETVDGQTTYVINDQYGFVMIRCDGTSWHIIG